MTKKHTYYGPPVPVKKREACLEEINTKLQQIARKEEVEQAKLTLLNKEIDEIIKNIQPIYLTVGQVTKNSVQLKWMSPDVPALAYVLRYNTEGYISNDRWAASSTASGVPAPSQSGTLQTFTLSGLTASTTYWFAIKSTYNVTGETAALGNSPSAKTLDEDDDTPPPEIIDPDAGEITKEIFPPAIERLSPLGEQVSKVLKSLQSLKDRATALKFELLQWSLPIEIMKIPLMLVGSNGSTTIRCKRLDRDIGGLIDLDFISQKVAFWVTKLFSDEIDGPLLYVFKGTWTKYRDEAYGDDFIPQGRAFSLGWSKGGRISPLLLFAPHPGCLPVLNNIGQYRYVGYGEGISFRFMAGEVTGSTRKLIILDGAKTFFESVGDRGHLWYSAQTMIASVYVHAVYLKGMPSGSILELTIGDRNFSVNL